MSTPVAEPPAYEPEVVFHPAATARRRNPVRAAFAAVIRAIPTLLVLAVAGAVGWWGHKNEWKVPKFSELSGVVKERDDWCGEHNVPESQCTRCDASLVPAFKATGDWCDEHGLPKSQCLACDPALRIERPPEQP